MVPNIFQEAEPLIMGVRLHSTMEAVRLDNLELGIQLAPLPGNLFTSPQFKWYWSAQWFMFNFRSSDFDDYQISDPSPSPGYNPATPGYQPDTPQGPYTPQTPGGAGMWKDSSAAGSESSFSLNPSPSPSGSYSGKLYSKSMLLFVRFQIHS